MASGRGVRRNCIAVSDTGALLAAGAFTTSALHAVLQLGDCLSEVVSIAGSVKLHGL